MMREHMGLYRGKRKYNGEWVEGYLFKCILNPIQEWWEITTGKYTSLGKLERYKVDPDTVGECTGLPDRNGKLIFEGDIVEDNCGNVYEVVYTKESGSFIAQRIPNFLNRRDDHATD